ncbi:MAG: cupin domain-containing protein [Bacteroidia bacterium]
METLTKPEVVLLKTGNNFKVLEVKGIAGMEMPEHHTTNEATLLITEGSAVLKMDGKDILLQKDEVFFVPANKKHSLLIKTKFKARVVMAKDCAIEFSKF